MLIDIRPTDVDMKCKEETKYHMSIRHKKSRIMVAGSGDNKFALECELLERIRQKMKDIEEKEHARGSAERRA